MDELELYCASKTDMTKNVLLVGNCGIERIEEFFSYTNLRDCLLNFVKNIIYYISGKLLDINCEDIN